MDVKKNFNPVVVSIIIVKGVFGLIQQMRNIKKHKNFLNNYTKKIAIKILFFITILYHLQQLYNVYNVYHFVKEQLV